jgi:hypothetical protein
MLKAGAVPKENRDAKMIGFLPTPTLRAELERIAEREERSLSYLCYVLVLKGLDAYEKDHELRSPRNLPARKSKNSP